MEILYINLIYSDHMELDLQIVEDLGEGGMCRVYKAREKATDRIVALKVLKEELAASEEQCKRFEREARVGLELRYPSIVQVYNFGYHEGLPAISMEFIEGSDLRKTLADGVQLLRGLEIMLSVLDALGYAHEKGVIHRDLKPENVMITKRGFVKVADWGLARSFEDPSGLTKTGLILGTPAYMSPEQIRGEKLSPASDLYALGIMIFEIAAGQLPFDTSKMKNSLSFHVQGRVPGLRKYLHTAPKSLAELVAQLMQKNPGKRPENAAVTGQRLGTIVSELRTGKTAKQQVEKTLALVEDEKPELGGRGKFLLIPIFLLLLVLTALFFSKSGRKEQIPLVVSKAILTAPDRLEIHFSGPSKGSLTADYVNTLSGLPALQGKQKIDLSQAKQLSREKKAVVLEPEPVIALPTLISVTGGEKEFETLLAPEAVWEKFLEPFNRISDEKFKKLLLELHKIRQELKADQKRLRDEFGNQAYKPYYAGGRAEKMRQVRALLDEAVTAEAVERFSGISRSMAKSGISYGSAVFQLLQRLRDIEGALVERGSVELPWKTLTEVLGERYGALSKDEIVEGKKGDPELFNWCRAVDLSLRTEVDEKNQWCWISTPNFVRSSAGRSMFVSETMLTARRGILKEHKAYLGYREFLPPMDKLTDRIEKKITLSLPDDFTWPPEEARLEIVTRLFAKDFQLVVNLGKKCRLLLFNSCLWNSSAGGVKSSGSLWLSVPLDPRVLTKDEFDLTVHIEKPSYLDSVANSMCIHSIRIYVK